MAASERKIAVMFQSGSRVCLEQRSSSFRKILHVRNDGIKSFVRSVRQKDWGCYLLNQDYGPV
ncbi:LpxL/LpxP family acyltransferase [Escherichia coli]